MIADSIVRMFWNVKGKVKQYRDYVEGLDMIDLARALLIAAYQ